MAQQRLGRVQWRDLVFGPGSPYSVTTIEGVDDLPEIRAEDMPRPGQHGDYTGPDYVGPRVIPMGLGLRAETPDGLRKLSLALRAATQPQARPEPLQFLDQGVMVWAKVRRRSIPYDAEYLWRIGDAALEFYCADPYLYGLEEKAAWTTAYSPSVGRAYPLAYTAAPAASNLALNPSVETDLNLTASYNAVSRTRLVGTARIGSASIQHTQTSASNFSGTLWNTAVITGGTVYAGAWVHLPTTGVTSVFWAFRSGGTTLTTVSLGTSTPTGQWAWVTGQYTLAAGQTVDQVGLACVADPGTVWIADGLRVDTAPFTTYGDGSIGAWSWTGTPHASTSVQPALAAGRTYGAQGTSGRLTAVNEGAADAYPVLRLDGPVANPSIEQVTTGGALVLDATLQPDEHLLIDTRSRAVLLMGSSPRRAWVRAGSVWPTLQPGTNEIAYRGSALPGAPGQSSLLTVTWRDTSL
ncbi:phage distal tail protein [Streptomyces leeuwenhoekii]|uniref:phage distal tail protein n=1 Tax=Streptomyces leeuwenhoekii TaxID=1437453 RepID=UPI0037028347